MIPEFVGRLPARGCGKFTAVAAVAHGNHRRGDRAFERA
jgi:hypothetical protein